MSGSMAKLCLYLGVVDAVKVMLIHDTAAADKGWREGFQDFFVPRASSVDLSTCDLSVASAQGCVDRATAAAAEVLVVADDAAGDAVRSAAEVAKIPNVHCAGADPVPWSADRFAHAFGIQLPYTFNSQGVVKQASSLGLSSVVILRDYDDVTLRRSAAAALQWTRDAALRVVGPTLEWCNRWSLQTRSCLIRANQCRCGQQEEVDLLNLEYQVETTASFYEVSETLVLEAGGGTGRVSPNLVAFVEGILEDVRSQGADPDVVLSFLSGSSSGLKAMQMKSFAFQMYFTAQPSEIQSSWSNGTSALTTEDALYQLSHGQWHPDMPWSDPIFGSTQQMILSYQQRFGYPPSAEAAACVAAGVTLVHSLQRYARPLEGLGIDERRQEIRYALGRFNDETIFGKINFNRFNQNVGRSSVTLQVLENGTIRPVMPLGAAPEVLRFPSPSWEVRSGCPAGTFASANRNQVSVPVECVRCEAGTFRSNASKPLEPSSCELCPGGRGAASNETGLKDCPLCPPGRYGRDGLCQACPLGRFQNDTGWDSCRPCESQSFADEVGLVNCKACPSGSSQPEVGQAYCVCDVGYFSDPTDGAPGATRGCQACETFLPGSTTVHPGAKTSAACVCPPGSFWHRPRESSAAADCKRCGEGLVCPGGLAQNSSEHQAPLQAAGYSAGLPSYLGADPPYIVTCTSKVRCPSLPVGSCPAGNQGKGCVNCKDRHYDDGGLCRPCSESTFVVWPLIAALLLAMLALAVLYKFATSVDRASRDSVATILLAAGFVLVIMQSVPDFGKVQVEWIEPLKTFREVFSFMTLSVETLRPGCWLNGRSPLANYLGSLATYPMGVLSILCLLATAKHVFQAEVTWNDAVQAIGVMLLAFYIALTSLTLRPFRCVQNPDGTASLAYYRDIICWKDDVHWAMLAVSLLPFFGAVVSFYAITLWAVLSYASKVNRSGGVKFVKSFSFLFGRFNPQHYYFILILNTRNLLIASIPVLLQMSNEVMFTVFMLTLAIYGLLEAFLCPWRTRLSNILDAGLTVFLIAAVTMGIILLDFDVARQTVIIQVMSLISFLVFFLGILCLLAVAAYRLYRPTRSYGIFLSHHKLGAACLARWFKMMLTDYITDHIFLDSDDVSKLDAILDVTSWDTENVVVLMTSETMKRMWCAAEVASAWDSGTNLVLVSCDGNRITRGLIEEVPELWSEQQQATLASTGINIQMILDAYEDLLTAPVIPLARKGARTDPHQEAVREVLGQCKGVKRQVLPRLTMQLQRSASFSAPSHAIYIIGDINTPEPGCCCRVIQTMLQASVQEMVTVINPAQAVLDLDSLIATWTGAKVILVVLTHGVLHEPTFAGSLCCCPESKFGVLVPVKADEQFAYPDPTFWQSLLHGQIFSPETLRALNTDFASVKKTYTTLFNVLALKFTSHGSAHILATEILVLKGRLMPLMMESSEIQRLESERRLHKLRQMSFARSEASQASASASMPSDGGEQRPNSKGLPRSYSQFSRRSHGSSDTSSADAPVRLTNKDLGGRREVHQTTMNGQTVQIVKEEL